MIVLDILGPISPMSVERRIFRPMSSLSRIDDPTSCGVRLHYQCPVKLWKHLVLPTVVQIIS